MPQRKTKGPSSRKVPRNLRRKRYREDVLKQFIELPNLLVGLEEKLPEASKAQPVAIGAPGSAILDELFSRFTKLLPQMDLKDFKGRYPDGLENKDDENQDDENQDWVVFEARDTRKGQVVGWVWKGPLSWKAPGLFSLPLNRSYGADRTIAVYRLCCAVREVLTKLVEGLGKRSPWSLSVGAIAERNLWVDENGDVVIEPDAFYDGFLPALAECGAQRIKRCPIPKCAKFFWAKPKNKGACDQHLGLARVWRKRGKIPQYNESRRFRREKKLRGVRGNNYKQKQLLGLNRALTKGGDD